MDAFAARAMAAEITITDKTARYSGDRQCQLIADKAYRFAAAMLEARKKYVQDSEPDKTTTGSLLDTPSVPRVGEANQ